jgi:hypothetical protein
MQNRKIRNFALAAMTIPLLGVLGATSVSASTNPICSGGAPRDCVQIFGNGLQVTQATGWVWNNTGMQIGSAHIEWYLAPISQSPLAVGSNFQFNYPVGAVNPNSNSKNAFFGSETFSAPVDVCSASWQDSGNSHFFLGFACGRVA